MTGTSLCSIVFVLKVLINTLTATDGFNLTQRGTDKMSIYANVAAFLNAAQDKIFAVCTDDPVGTTPRKCAGLDSKALAFFARGFAAAKD